jgi:hypothetical protein
MARTGQQIVNVRAATQADAGIVGQWGAELVALHHGNLRTAYDRDPDPSDDRPGAEAEEPSNEWPGAQP